MSHESKNAVPAESTTTTDTPHADTPHADTIVDRVFDVGTIWVTGVLKATKKALDAGADKLHDVAAKVGHIAGELSTTIANDANQDKGNKAA